MTIRLRSSKARRSSTALLFAHAPLVVPDPVDSTLRLPGVPQSGQNGSQGEWVFDYVLGTDHQLVEPGTPIAVRPGGCLYTSYSSLFAGGYGQITDKDCGLGLVAGTSKTHALGAVRRHFGADPLRVDFGKKARPHVEDASGNPVFGTVGSQGVGAVRGLRSRGRRRRAARADGDDAGERGENAKPAHAQQCYRIALR